MRWIVASDHVGFPLKSVVVEYLLSCGEDIDDAGPFSTEMLVDYPDYAFLVGQAVSRKEYDRGILVCGTGLGMSIAANKVPGVRAVLCTSEYYARLSRAHNNANVLCLGRNATTPERAIDIIAEWARTPFDQGRHVPRQVKMDHYLDHFPSFSAKNILKEKKLPWKYSFAISLGKTVFGPVLFAGDLEKGLQAACDVGFEFIELSLRSPQDYTIDGMVQLVNSFGLQVSAIATGQSCLHDAMCLSSTSADLRRQAVSRLKDHIQLARQLNSQVIIGGIRGRLSGSTEERQEQRELAIQAIQEVVGNGEQFNVPILLEPINRYETNFVNTIDEGLGVIREVGSANLKLLFDTFHTNIEEVDPCASLYKAGDQIGYVHVADSNRYAPGLGHIDFHSTILAPLLEMNYQGYISAEILPIPDDWAAVRQTASYFHLKGSVKGETL